MCAISAITFILSAGSLISLTFESTIAGGAGNARGELLVVVLLCEAQPVRAQHSAKITPRQIINGHLLPATFCDEFSE
jgi:hypothetical protein